MADVNGPFLSAEWDPAETWKAKESLKIFAPSLDEEVEIYKPPKRRTLADDAEEATESLRRLRQHLEKVGEAAIETREVWARLGEQMRGLYPNVVRAVCLPHQVARFDENGWLVCERCGAESHDVELLREVPCAEADGVG